MSAFGAGRGTLCVTQGKRGCGKGMPELRVLEETL